MIALRPHDLNHFIKTVFVYEVDQYLLWGENTFISNYFESINIDNKIKAYELYVSQIRSFRPSELLRKYAYIKGLSCQVEYAESFKLIRSIGN